MGKDKRKEEEKKEGLPVVDNNAPGERFQNSQQVANTGATKIDGPKSDGFQLREDEHEGSILKQEVASKVVKGESYGGVNSGMGIAANGRSVGGSDDGVLGSGNATPVAGKSRGDGRVAKKLDRQANHLNYTPNEQILRPVKESRPLAESADLDQGYNGTYRNEFFRSQKIAGNVPAELMMDRSVDMIFKDMLYYPQGQQIKITGKDYGDTVKHTAVLNEYGVYVAPDEDAAPNYVIKRGNFLHRKAHFIFSDNADGKLDTMYFEVDDLTPTLDLLQANRACVNSVIDRNVAELDRQVLDEKVGDEKAEKWSPLPRAVLDPTLLCGFLRDHEALTGNEVYLSYKKFTTSHAFQLNRALKDGQEAVEPAIEALVGCIGDYNSRNSFKQAYFTGGITNLEALIKDKALNARGSAGLAIAIQDSPSKYKTKADLLLQPRSFRMGLQTADNNINPLKVSKRFPQIVDACETFSTIDRDYDPMLPLLVTDKAANIVTYNYNALFGFYPDMKEYELTANISGSTEFESKLVVPAELINGDSDARFVHVLIDDVTSGAGTFTSVNGVLTPNTNVEACNVQIIINESNAKIGTKASPVDGYWEPQNPFALSTFKTTGCYAAVIKSSDHGFATPINATRLFMSKAGPFTYVYSDIRNSYVIHVRLPLLEGIVQLIERDWGSRILANISGKEWTLRMVHSTQFFSMWSYLVLSATPYILTSRVNSMRDVLYVEKEVGFYPFSQLMSMKDAPTKSYSNFDYVDYDTALQSKVMKPAVALRWQLPEKFWVMKRTAAPSNTIVMPWYFNEKDYNIGANDVPTVNYDQSNMSMPSIRAGVKLQALDNLYGMTEKDIRLSLDRVLPFIPTTATKMFVYKYGVMTDGIPVFLCGAPFTLGEWLSQPREMGYVIDAPYGLLTAKIESEEFVSISADATTGSSDRIRYWLNKNAVKFTLEATPADSEQQILKASGVNVTRAANFVQEWFEFVANGKAPGFDHGFVFSLNEIYGNNHTLIPGRSKFYPLYKETTKSADTGDGAAISLMKALWTRIQILPYVISPFEGEDRNNVTWNTTNDPFDFAYFFGLCGFRASDYRESVYNREKEFVNQGLMFVNDPWVDASPLFKEGAAASGVDVTKGYHTN